MVLWEQRPLQGNLPPRICVVDRGGGIYTYDSVTRDWVIETVYVPHHYANLNFGGAAFPLSATGVVGVVPIGTEETFYIYSVEAIMEVSSTNDASNFWTLAVRKPDGTAIGQSTTEADAADTVLRKVITVTEISPNPVSPSTAAFLIFKAEKTGSPGDLLYCELIVKVLDVISPA